MAPKKHPLRQDRIRRPPKEGWSWIDRRFIREKASALDRDAILLYFFLAAVSDKDGLSYWSDVSIAGHLRMSAASVSRACEELQRHDLISYEKPFYQVLSLPGPPPARGSSEPHLLAEIFRDMAQGGRTNHPSGPPKGENP